MSDIAKNGFERSTITVHRRNGESVDEFKRRADEVIAEWTGREWEPGIILASMNIN